MLGAQDESWGRYRGTRAGNLDPEILTHLLEQGMTLDGVRRMLHHEAGLQGLAGSHDMRGLLRRDDPAAALAVEIFCYRIVKCVGSYLTVLGGAEAVVFTGGIGENSPEIRRRVCRGLRWVGVEIDDLRNDRGEERISGPASRIAAYAIRSDEETVIARGSAFICVRPDLSSLVGYDLTGEPFGRAAPWPGASAG